MLYKQLMLLSFSIALTACGGTGDVVTGDKAQTNAATETILNSDDNKRLHLTLLSTKNYRFSGDNNSLFLSGDAKEIKIAGNNNKVEIYGKPGEVDVTGNDNSIKTYSNVNDDIEDRGSGNQFINF